MGDDGEAELLAELLEFGSAGLGSVAEAEIVTFVNLDGVERLLEDLVGEVEGGEAREILGEGDHDSGIDAALSDQIEALRERRDEARGLFGAENANWMGIEGDGKGLRAKRNSALADVVHDGLMAEVNAVEVADGEDRSGEAGGNRVE